MPCSIFSHISTQYLFRPVKVFLFGRLLYMIYNSYDNTYVLAADVMRACFVLHFEKHLLQNRRRHVAIFTCPTVAHNNISKDKNLIDKMLFYIFRTYRENKSFESVKNFVQNKSFIIS